MRKQFNIPYFITLLMCMMIGLSSCHEETYIEVMAVTSCSSDLLEFVIPTVTIAGENGECQTFELSRSDFMEAEENNEFINMAECSKRFDVGSINGVITVSYSLKPEIELNKESYEFYHGVTYDYYNYSKGIGVTTTFQKRKPTPTLVAKNEVEKYLNTLVSKQDETIFIIAGIKVE